MASITDPTGNVRVCIRCGQPFRGRCGSCGHLRALVSDDELTDGTVSWSFEVWQEGKNDGPVGTLGGFSSSGEALAAAHEFIRHYVHQHLSAGRRPGC
jgi:hypothetical protein